MKTILLVIATVLLFQSANAQTWDEWFKQKKTQKKYLVQQIAALRVYLDYLKKGYTVVHNGLNTIITSRTEASILTATSLAR